MKTVNENMPGSSNADLHYDTRGWSPGQAFEFDREALRATYDLRRPTGTGGHWFKSDIRLLCSLMLARNDGGGSHILVRDSRHIEENPGHYLKMQIFSMPGGSVATGDRIMTLDPMSVFVIDQSRPYRQTMPAGKNLTFFLPHARVNYDPAAMPAVLRFDGGATEGRFLSNIMRMVFRLAGVASVAEGFGLAQAICGSVGGLLEGHVSQTGRSALSRTARIEAARRVIDLKIADPAFGVDDVLAEVGASRATLYRDFAPMGGLMAYVKSRRLEKAYRILSMSRPRRGAISNAAASAGFASLACFSREFRELFGSAPSDILGQWRSDSEDSLGSSRSSPTAAPDPLRAIYTWSNATTAIGHLAHHGAAQV
jgi:AraC-like DNA-binding protein